MKKAGMIAGIGPASTVAYYQSIISSFQQRLGTAHYPEMVIHNIDMTAMLELVHTRQLDKLVSFLKTRIRVLKLAGADFAFLSSNTPHLVFDQLASEVALPMISIVEACCREIEALGLKKVGLLGTKSTMNAGFYQEKARAYGFEICIPGTDEQDYVNEKYMTELLYNNLLPDTRKGLLHIVNTMRTRDQIDGIILGGTELPLILSQADLPDFPLLDTTQIHVKAIVDNMLIDQGN